MQSTSILRPAPRWVHVWAIITVTITATLLLTLGSLVTTYRAGMADPIWPTTPWYLFTTDFSEPSPGYLIEHTHRIAGFTVGGAMAVLAIGLWLTDPRRWTRWLGLIGLIVLLAAFGDFHRRLMEQREAPQVALPMQAVGGMAVGLLILLACIISGLLARTHSAGLQAIGVLTLVCVMIQGLLGGFRVRLNALVGTDLAPTHGVFAQVVFAMLVSLAVLTAKPSTRPILFPDERSRCRRLAIGLVAIVFLQLIWGALIRHNPTPLVQRLHLITAFLVVAAALWLIKTVHDSTTSWPRLRWPCLLLGTLLTLQILFGVEAWMGKFASGILPELQKITTSVVIVRTGHVLIGTGILATSVGIALLTRRPVSIEQFEHPIAPDFSPMALAESRSLGDHA